MANQFEHFVSAPGEVIVEGSEIDVVLKKVQEAIRERNPQGPLVGQEVSLTPSENKPIGGMKEAA